MRHRRCTNQINHYMTGMSEPNNVVSIAEWKAKHHVDQHHMDHGAITRSCLIPTAAIGSNWSSASPSSNSNRVEVSTASWCAVSTSALASELLAWFVQKQSATTSVT